MAHSDRVDRGSKFIGHNFLTMIRDDYKIKKKPISVRSPQAAAIIERVHQAHSYRSRFLVEWVGWVEQL